MNFSAAINETMHKFGLSAKAIATAADITPAALSEYRNGKREVKTSTLESILSALPADARQYLFLHCLVGQMDSTGLALLLNAVSNRLTNKNHPVESVPDSSKKVLMLSS
jgi:transcriptional regulator with XRE-family HTH domain